MYQVYTSTYMFVTYFLFTYMYVKVYKADVLCTDASANIYFMKCTDIIELCMYTDVSFWFQLFALPCWPVGRDLQLPGVTPIQAQAH
jgi:hypothetical protein